MADPWAAFNPQPAPASGMAPAIRPLTAPRPDAYKVEDQAFQREAAERARQAEARAVEDQNFQREKFEFEKTKAVSDPKLVEAERTAAFLATRVAGGIKDLQTALAKEPGAAKPTVGQAAAGMFGPTARGLVNTPARRQVEAAQMDVLDAALTLGTGAAYTKEQLEGYRASYFPTLTDDPATIADKKTRLERLLTAARIKAGGAAPKIDEALASLGGNPSPPDSGEPLPLADFTAQMQALIADRSKPPEQRMQEALAFAQANRRMVRPEEIEAAIANGAAKVTEDPNFLPPGGGQSIPAQLGEATANVITGVGQGLAALPDMAANAAGAVLAVPADALGFDGVAQSLRNPATIGGLLERANPSQGGVAGGVRMAAQFGGGVAGFPQRAANALTNAVVGQVPTRVIPNALAPSGNSVMRAADDLGASVGSPVQPIAADVGGATTRRLTSLGAQLPLSARPIVNASQRLGNQSQAARDTVAGRVGEALDPEMAGEAAKRGLGVYRTRTGQQARTMYQAAETASEGVKIEPTNVMQSLAGHIAEQKGIPGGSDILPVLENLASSLSQNGAFTVSGVRGMRTVLSSRLTTAGLTPTNAQRIVNELVQAAGDDITSSLVKAGKPDAAKAYRSADKFYAERMDVINNALKPIIGKNGEKSGEQVLQAIQQAAKGNTARLSQIMRVLPEDDAGTVRATLISQLGKSSAGTQNAEGSAFSLGQFLTHWNQMTPRARSILFDRGTLTDLNNLAKVADGSKQAARYANSSNTGGVVGGIATGATLATDMVTVAGTALAQFGGGMLLAAPGFARWMARAPSNPRAVSPHIARLTTIASQNPTMATEIKGLQQFLTEAFEQSPGRIAAGQNEGDRR